MRVNTAKGLTLKLRAVFILVLAQYYSNYHCIQIPKITYAK